MPLLSQSQRGLLSWAYVKAKARVSAGEAPMQCLGFPG